MFALAGKVSLPSAPEVNEPPPLPADEQRRAHATTGAFIFQWWLSVLAWLELRDEEALYVESAEDFETVSAATGTATQVKAGTSRSMTLRSEEVIDALNNYWALQQKERRAIRFVLLTRADIGQEQAAPLGTGVNGLELWMQVAEDDSDPGAEAIRKFLASDALVAGRLSPELRAFCEKSTPAEMRAKLIKPVVFDVRRLASAAVRTQVEERIIVLGAERHGATVAEARRVPAILFTQVAEYAGTKERLPLTRAKLLRILEEATVEHRKTLCLALPSEHSADGVLAAAGTAAVWQPPVVDLALPPLPEAAAPRVQAVASLLAELHQSAALFLHGSTGMGKTTLAKFVATADGGRWYWVDLQGCPLSAVQWTLRHLLQAFDHNRGTAVNVVLDGLSLDGLPAAALNTMRAVVWLMRRRGGRLIVTMQRPLTATEGSNLGCASPTVRAAPPMSDAEITEYATRMGCAEAKAASAWGSILQLQTSGHPQLVHAALLALQRSGWPQLSAGAFQQSSEGLKGEREQARRLVAGLQAEELELLTRLCVLRGSFRRDHALALAEKLERLPRAAFQFDQLLGPWIEPANRSGYHRLSPLLDDRTALVAAVRLRQMEQACALARLETPPIYSHDAADALEHAMAAEDGRLILGIVAKLLTTDKTNRVLFLRDFLWITWMPAEKCAGLFSRMPALDAMFRTLQFQVAVELIPAQSLVFFDQAEKAILRLPEDLRNAQHFALVTEALFADASPLPVARRLAYGLRAAELAEKLSPEFPVDDWLPDSVLPMMPPGASTRQRVLAAMTGLLLMRTEGREALGDLVAALDALPGVERTVFESSSAAWPTTLMLAFDKIWLEEGKKTAPAWELLLDWFAEIEAKAAAWPSEVFAVAAARAASIVCNEYLQDQPRAACCLATVKPVLPAYRSAVLDQSAKISAQSGHYGEALAKIREALPLWDGSEFGSHGKMLALQRAGCWAGKVGDWDESGRQFEAGAELAQASELPVSAAGLAADAGYALWEAGNKPRALRQFTTAIDLCEKMPDPATDLAAFQFQKILGHMLLTLAMPRRKATERTSLAPLVAGMASDPELREKVKSLPPPRLDSCRVFLAMLEHDHGLGEALWNRWAAELLASPSLSNRHFALELAGRKAIQRASASELAPLAMQMAIHLHFLLGRHQLTDGHKHSYTSAEVASFLKNAWKAHGMAKVEIYDSSRPGIEYVLRREDDHCHNDVEMSEALTAVIKKAQRVERDPLVSDLVEHLRSQGVKAGFGDFIESVRRGAA